MLHNHRMLLAVLLAAAGAEGSDTGGSAQAAAASNKPAKTPVSLENGKTAEFGEKEKMQLEIVVNQDFSASVGAYFRNGKVITGSIPAKLAQRAMGHGLTQKVRDSIAGDKTVDDAIASVEDVLEALTAGEWNQTREASSTGPKGNSLELIDAVAKVRKIPQETVKTWLAERTPAEKTKLRNVPEIALEIAKARAAKAKAAAKEGGEAANDPFEGLATGTGSK